MSYGELECRRHCKVWLNTPPTHPIHSSSFVLNKVMDRGRQRYQSLSKIKLYIYGMGVRHLQNYLVDTGSERDSWSRRDHEVVPC